MFSLADSNDVRCVSIVYLESRLLTGVASYEGRGSSNALSAYDLPFSPSLFFFFLDKLANHLKVDTEILVEAFLTRRHKETLSALELTLFQSISRCTGELLSSMSRVVRRKSSIASLMAVRTTMTINGTALRPGLVAPNILKNYWMC